MAAKALYTVLLPATVALAGCVLPVVQQQGGAVYVEAYRSTAAVALPDFREPRPSERSEAGELVVIPLYEHRGWPTNPKFELLRPVVISGNGGKVNFPYRLNLSSSNYTAFGWRAPPDRRPQLWALVFAEGCWPRLLKDETSSNARSGICRVSEDFPDDDRQPPKGHVAQLRCIFVPSDTEGHDTYVCLLDAGSSAIGEFPPELLSVIGDEGDSRFFALIERARLSASQKRMVYAQLHKVLEKAASLPDNAPYSDTMAKLSTALAERESHGAR